MRAHSRSRHWPVILGVKVLPSVAALAIAAVLVAASPALAATDDVDGLWYVDGWGLDEIHATGLSGEGVTIAVIDSPLNVDLATFQGANIETISLCLDENGDPRPPTSTDIALADHGTNVTGLVVGSGEGSNGNPGIRGVAPGAHILHYADYGGFDDELKCYLDGQRVDNGADILGLSIEDAMDRGADIISSSSGGGSSFILEDAVIRALREEVILVFALPNPITANVAAAEQDGPPSGFNGVVAVQGVDIDGVPILSSGEPRISRFVEVEAPGIDILGYSPRRGSWEDPTQVTGNSYATPLVAGLLALAMEKYPEATPNQILQALTRHTFDQEDPNNPQWHEVYGYGLVEARAFLEGDPTTYPRNNPFLLQEPDYGPRPYEIWPNPDDEFDFSVTDPNLEPLNPTPTPEPTDTDAYSSLLPLLIIIAAIVLLAVIMFIIIAIARTKGGGHGRQ